MSEKEKNNVSEDAEIAADANEAAKPGKAEIKKTKKTEKQPEKKKSGIAKTWGKIRKWLREMRSELKKVQWTGPKQVLNNTLIVIVCVIIIGAFIWAFDWLAGTGVSTLISLFKG